MLNYKLAKRRGILRDDLYELERLHARVDELASLWNRERLYDGVDQTEYSRKLVSREVKQLEYRMQRAWGFTEDASEHTHWRRFPGLRPKREVKERESLLASFFDDATLSS